MRAGMLSLSYQTFVAEIRGWDLQNSIKINLTYSTCSNDWIVTSQSMSTASSGYSQTLWHLRITWSFLPGWLIVVSFCLIQPDQSLPLDDLAEPSNWYCQIKWKCWRTIASPGGLLRTLVVLDSGSGVWTVRTLGSGQSQKCLLVMELRHELIFYFAGTCMSSMCSMIIQGHFTFRLLA